MDFIALEPKNWAAFWLLISLAMVVGGGLITFCAARLASSDGATPRFKGIVLPIAGLVVGFSISIWSLGSILQIDDARWNERNTAVIDQIEATYGEDLKSIDELSYPLEKPTEDFQVFGSYTEDEPTDSGFLRTETHLVWKDGQMILATSADGEIFDELER